MTKVTTLEELSVEHLSKRKIKFISHLTPDGIFRPSYTEPKHWSNIVLLSKDYVGGMDLMFAYDASRDVGGTLYLGHFNDGVV